MVGSWKLVRTKLDWRIYASLERLRGLDCQNDLIVIRAVSMRITALDARESEETIPEQCRCAIQVRPVRLLHGNQLILVSIKGISSGLDRGLNFCVQARVKVRILFLDPLHQCLGSISPITATHGSIIELLQILDIHCRNLSHLLDLVEVRGVAVLRLVVLRRDVVLERHTRCPEAKEASNECDTHNEDHSNNCQYNDQSLAHFFSPFLSVCGWFFRNVYQDV